MLNRGCRARRDLTRHTGRQALEGAAVSFESLDALVQHYRSEQQTDLPGPLARMCSTDV